MQCKGRNLDEHCCWLSGRVCQFLEENTEPGFRWSCGLRRELGNWDAVIIDRRYQQHVAPNIRTKGANCRDYPSSTAGGPCQLCGAGK